MKKKKILSKCCACHKVRRKKDLDDCHRVHMDEWGHHKKDIVEMHREYDLVYSHGYCDPCAEEFMRNEGLLE